MAHPTHPGRRPTQKLWVGWALIGRWLVVFAAAHGVAADPVPISLFNGRDLTGWETWLGSPRPNQPELGWNQDPQGVFRVVTTDGEPAIRCSGEVCGSLVSRSTLENYRLRLEFKWGEQRWPPREHDQRDSGVFYHTWGSQPPKGNCWLSGSQCSLAERDSGDFWPIGVEGFATAKRMDGTPVDRATIEAWYQRNGVNNMPWEWSRSGLGQWFGGGLKSSVSADRPRGQWNVVELLCEGDRATHVINGVTNLILLHLRQNHSAKPEPLTRGRIQLQSEGAEIYFRRIEYTPLTALPQAKATK